jgi:hypothetical protein
VDLGINGGREREAQQVMCSSVLRLRSLNASESGDSGHCFRSSEYKSWRRERSRSSGQHPSTGPVAGVSNATMTRASHAQRQRAAQIAEVLRNTARRSKAACHTHRPRQCGEEGRKQGRCKGAWSEFYMDAAVLSLITGPGSGAAQILSLRKKGITRRLPGDSETSEGQWKRKGAGSDT